jgi:hypothetical protein
MLESVVKGENGVRVKDYFPEFKEVLRKETKRENGFVHYKIHEIEINSGVERDYILCLIDKDINQR